MERLIEWFVKATRNNTTVQLPAPEGQSEAEAMAGHLRGFDWHDVEVLDRTLLPEPEPESKPEPHHGKWPLCERCTRKHSPFPHEVEGCPHCMAICQPPTAKKAKTKPEPEALDERPKFRHGMTFQEFTNWIEGAL